MDCPREKKKGGRCREVAVSGGSTVVKDDRKQIILYG